MKLKTMLLPTGEFVLVGSETRTPRNDAQAENLREAIKAFKEAAGAAAFFITDEVVETEDALVDPAARRAEPRDEPEDDGEYDLNDSYFRTYLPNVHIPAFEVDGDGNINLAGEARAAGWSDLGELDKSFSLTFDTSPEDIAVTRAVMEGREVSPAGVIKGQEGDPTFTEGDLAGEPTDEPIATEGDIVGDEDEPMGQEVDTPVRDLIAYITGARPVTPAVDAKKDADMATLAAWPGVQTIRVNDQTVAQVPREFQPGDEVLVNGTSYLGTRVTDLEATVVKQHAAGALYRSTQNTGHTVLVRDHWSRQMYFHPESVMLVKEA